LCSSLFSLLHFFLSSRRRHTRSKRDWSSDVCSSDLTPAQVAYASKAFSSVAMLQIIKQEGLSLDVVSCGELYTAIKADFPTKKIHMHGNNKSLDELDMAIKYDIGCIVIDNFYEIDL